MDRHHRQEDDGLPAYARQNSHRKNVKRSTEKGREYLMSVLKSDPLGSRSIDTVKLSDAKEWAIRMSEKGYAYKTISNWKRSLKAAFYTAIKDDCIRKNPFNFAMDTVLEDDTEEKVALTRNRRTASWPSPAATRSTGSIAMRSSSCWGPASASPSCAV